MEAEHGKAGLEIAIENIPDLIITGEKFEFVLRSVLPWYIPRFAGMLIVTYIPFISTWLPNMLWD